MIPRGKTSAPTARVLTVPVRGRSGVPLPDLVTAPPAGVAAVVDAALDYADAHDGAEELGTRAALARAGYRALLVALPGVKRAEILERLRGLDRLADALGNHPAAMTHDDPPF